MEDIVSVESVLRSFDRKAPIDVQKVRLPIFKFKRELLYLLEKHQVLIIKGETGSGKSTQIPQYLVEAGWHLGKESASKQLLNNRAICISQPRRVSAIALAKRVAEETNSILGDKVGYAVRLDACFKKDSTCIKYVTDGLLIREMMSDPLLDKYSVVVVDEAHERNINTDLLIGCLKRVLKRRDDMRVIICSATIDTDKFVNFFSSDNTMAAPSVLCVEGRSHQCEIFYSESPVAEYVNASVETAIKIHEMNSLTSGDILIFLTGQEEIEQAMPILYNYSQSTKDRVDMKKLVVLPLYASLPHREIAKVFETANQNYRKCILATNVAETSLTIDGVAFVIDCGFVKLKIFNPITRSDSLVRVPISKAAAEQRAGRAGRTRDGQTYRLYSEESYELLNPFTIPEIQRCSLNSTILQLLSIGVVNIANFELPTKMPTRNVHSALEHLFALEAINSEGELTANGRQMSELPLDPQSAKLLLESSRYSCSREALVIISILQSGSIFLKPSSGHHAIKAKNIHMNLYAEEGDLITYLNVYNSFLESRKSKKWSEKNYLNHNALLRAGEIQKKLKQMLTRFKIEDSSTENTDMIRKCLVSGYFANAAYLHHDGDYRTIRGNHILRAHPTSVINSLHDRPKYVIFTEVLHTTQEYMCNIVSVEAEWLYGIAPNYYHFGTEFEKLRHKPH